MQFFFITVLIFFSQSKLYFGTNISGPSVGMCSFVWKDIVENVDVIRGARKFACLIFMRFIVKGNLFFS